MPRPLNVTDPDYDVHREWRLSKSRLLTAELVGTFALTMVDACGAMLSAMHPDEVTAVGRSLAAGLLIMVMTFALSNSSGAHFNPAVTFGFALRRAFPWKHVPLYWAMQFLGALLAAVLLRFGLGTAGDVGATLPKDGVMPGFYIEIFLTFLLVTVALSVATRHKQVGPVAPIAAGGTVALCGLFARPLSGASMNPARSLGPLLVSGHLDKAWIYLTAPFLGALVAFLVVAVVHPHRHEEEKAAAVGERNVAPARR